MKKNMYDSTKYMLEKEDSFHMDLVWKWPQLKPSPRCAGQWCVTGLPGVPVPTVCSTAWPVGGKLVMLEFLQGSSQ